MLTHYARTFDGLAYAQTLVDKLELRAFLLPQGSYVSVLELGLYDATGKIHAELSGRGLAPHSPEWIAGFDELVANRRRIRTSARGYGRRFLRGATSASIR